MSRSETSEISVEPGTRPADGITQPALTGTLDLDSHSLVVVANRLPVKRARGRWRPSAGGLVTAMRPVTEEHGGAWVGWSAGESEVPKRVEGLNVDLHPLTLTHAQVQGYYYGFSNRTVWPLFHDLVAKPVIDRRWWDTYREVNATFADATMAIELPDGRDPIAWVHDYHLMMLPGLLRERRPDLPIGYFLHIPFPPPELIAQLPWRDDLLRGLLGADVVGFHTERFRDNFVRACQRLFRGLQHDGRRLEVPGGRVVRTTAHPISIDTDEFTRLATDKATEKELSELREQFAGRRVVLGIDRVDYTKGIRHRLQAIEAFLERREDMRTRIAFVQIGVPSREDVKEYRELRTQIEREVGRINGRFTEPGHDVPVHYLYRSVPKPRLAAYYRLADTLLVTPLKDGMNLVAKEFVVCQGAGGEHGVLVLSEFAGAALELEEATPCNPYDVEGLAALIGQSLEVEPEVARRRIEGMAARVRRRNVYRWVDHQLGELTESLTDR